MATAYRRMQALREAASVRTALIVGFAVVFALWLLWGYQLVRSLDHIEQNVARVQESYAHGEQTLLRIRTSVLLGSIYLRDALIDGASPRREAYQRELARLRGDVDHLLAAYVPDVASAEERDHWSRLQVELADFWASREIAFGVGAKSAADAAALLRNRVVPRREGIIQILDQLAALQSVAYTRQQQDTDLLYRQVRRRLIATGAGTLIIAFFAAVLASRHVNHLQRQVEQQRGSERRTRQELERLSASLVDAQEQERRRLSCELHDAIGQALTAVKMDIGIALRVDIEPRVRAALEEARDITEATLHDVRTMSQLLHPSMLDDFGLPATLTAYLRRFSERTGIRAQLVESLQTRLQADTELCLYRIVQEATNNIAQHSAASGCTIVIDSSADAVRLVIEDNGLGASPGRPPSAIGRGLGVVGMRERAQALGGTFALLSTPSGGGTRVTITVPRRDAPAPTPDETTDGMTA